MNHISIIFMASLIMMMSCATSTEEVVEQAESTTGQIQLSEGQISKAGIVTGTFGKVELGQYVSARGIIDVPPTHRASVNVFHGGYVRKLDLLPGQQVKKGEVLFTIQNPEFIRMQETYLEAKSKLEFLESDYNRQKQLLNEAISSEKKFRQAESDFRVVQAQLGSIKEQLELINVNISALEKGNIVSEVPVYAAIAGFVSHLSINKGKYLSPQDVALQIINSEHMHLELKVYEKDVTKLQQGQKILFKVDNDDQEWEGEVHLIEKAIDQHERTVQVHGHLPDGSRSLVVGMYVDAKIQTGTSNVYAVPVEAVVDMDGAQFVMYQVDTGVFEKVEIQAGMRTEHWVEVKNHESLHNKSVVVKGAYEVMN